MKEIRPLIQQVQKTWGDYLEVKTQIAKDQEDGIEASSIITSFKKSLLNQAGKTEFEIANTVQKERERFTRKFYQALRSGEDGYIRLSPDAHQNLKSPLWDKIPGKWEDNQSAEKVFKLNVYALTNDGDIQAEQLEKFFRVIKGISLRSKKWYFQPEPQAPGYLKHLHQAPRAEANETKSEISPRSKAANTGRSYAKGKVSTKLRKTKVQQPSSPVIRAKRANNKAKKVESPESLFTKLSESKDKKFELAQRIDKSSGQERRSLVDAFRDLEDQELVIEARLAKVSDSSQLSKANSKKVQSPERRVLPRASRKTRRFTGRGSHRITGRSTRRSVLSRSTPKGSLGSASRTEILEKFSRFFVPTLVKNQERLEIRNDYITDEGQKVSKQQIKAKLLQNGVRFEKRSYLVASPEEWLAKNLDRSKSFR